MKDEIKEILEELRDSIDNTGTNKVDFINWVNTIEDYITNLEECHKNMFDINLENDKLIWDLQNENERLKQNQVKALNRIRDFINSSKCETIEGSYCNDKHSQYWELFKRFAEELQDKIKGIDTNDYVYIPRWREQELLRKEEQNEKAVEFIKNTPLYEITYDYNMEDELEIQNVSDETASNKLLNILNGRSDE